MCTLRSLGLAHALEGKQGSEIEITQLAMAGDILDGYHPKAESEAALDALLKVFDALEKPHWHMMGNHCLYNLPREVC